MHVKLSGFIFVWLDFSPFIIVIHKFALLNEDQVFLFQNR